MMREQFSNEFTAKLYGKVSDEVLKLVQNELFLHVQDYDIERRETAIGKYKGYLPECFKIYLVSRKIEGLSNKTIELYQMYLDDFFSRMDKDISDITSMIFEHICITHRRNGILAIVHWIVAGQRFMLFSSGLQMKGISGRILAEQ